MVDYSLGATILSRKQALAAKRIHSRSPLRSNFSVEEDYKRSKLAAAKAKSTVIPCVWLQMAKLIRGATSIRGS